MNISDVNIEHLLVSTINSIKMFLKNCFKYFRNYINHFNDCKKTMHIKLPKLNKTVKIFRNAQLQLKLEKILMLK